VSNRCRVKCHRVRHVRHANTRLAELANLGLGLRNAWQSNCMESTRECLLQEGGALIFIRCGGEDEGDSKSDIQPRTPTDHRGRSHGFQLV
jgi:hypothetical protein